jgi:hypothetical protein
MSFDRRNFLKIGTTDNSTRLARSTILLLLGVLTFMEPAPVQAAPDRTVQRPISDFVDAQGTTMVFTPPVPDQEGWANAPTLSNKPPFRFALFDYAGLANEYLISHQYPSLGTTIDGTVTERPLANGRAEVSVILHTTNALTWASDPNFDLNTSPTLFGDRVKEVLKGATPALGDSVLQVKFNNTAPGAPLPDLVNAFVLGNALPGQELTFISFRGTATGPLHAIAVLGPEGTPGLCLVIQTGLVAKLGGNGRPGIDGFPAELVELRAIGQ